MNHTAEDLSCMWSDEDCLFKWKEMSLNSTEVTKKSWTKEEDDKLRELVKINGPKKWSKTAQGIPGRKAKQCRERWYNHVDPNVNKAPWSLEEERIVLEKHREIGNRWSAISKLLQGRTDSAVKNHWNCYMKRKVAEYLANTYGSERSKPNPNDGRFDYDNDDILRMLPSMRPSFAVTSTPTSGVRPSYPALLSPTSRQVTKKMKSANELASGDEPSDPYTSYQRNNITSSCTSHNVAHTSSNVATMQITTPILTRSFSHGLSFDMLEAEKGDLSIDIAHCFSTDTLPGSVSVDSEEVGAGYWTEALQLLHRGDTLPSKDEGDDV